MPDQYELIATSVTSALGIRLREIFPSVTWYRETIPAQLLVYPHFFVTQLSVNATYERRNYRIIDYLATIRYREVADPSSITGSLQERLDDTGIKLLSELESITWGDMPVTLRDRYTEKVEGVLHFFCNVSVMAKKPIELGPLQEQLSTSINRR